jgi:hypothetical protein
MSRRIQDARPPEPGDLFVLLETAEFPVEWALLDRRSGDSGQLLAVAADTNPLAGSADVEIFAGEPAGPLSLRCRFGLWVDASRLDPSRRTGVLDPDAVARAMAKRAELETGEVTASPLAYEADADPEYQDWVHEVLAPAHSILSQPATADERSARPPVLRPGVRQSPHWSSLGNPYALAASVLLLVTLGLAGGLVWQTRTIADLAARRQSTERELLRERERRAGELQQAEEAHKQQMADRDRQAEQKLAEDRRRIADLESRLETSGRVSPLVNAPFVYLAPRDPVRGEPDAVPLPPGASYLFVILAVTDLRSFPEYRLEILSKETGKPVWTTAGLHKTGVTEVSVALPRALLPQGDYRLRLSGVKDGKAEPVGEYEMRIR